MENLSIVVFAAGKGNRFGGEHQKVIIEISGIPAITYLLQTLKKLGPSKIIIVVGFKKEEVIRILEDEKVEYVEQTEFLGTGDALIRAEKALEGYTGNILIVCGDVPFLTEKTLRELINIHNEKNNFCTILTTVVDNPTGYGRIKKDKNGSIVHIVEELDASPEEKNIKEINTGVYVFKAPDVFKYLQDIPINPVKGEYYLTDVVKIIKEDNRSIGIYTTEKWQETMGLNTSDDLHRAEDYFKRSGK